jgi:uncharacterized protein (TIGR02466 family)
MIINPFNDLFYEYNLKIEKEELNQIKLLLLQYENLQINTDKDQLSTYYLVNNIKTNILNFPILKKLKEQIINILDYHNLFLANSWIQIYKKNQKHIKHTHTNSAYSGIIYVDGNKNSGQTLFYHPLRDRLVSDYDINFIEIFKPEFKINKLILFPSYIVHEVLEEKEKSDRTIISFNTKFKV